MKILINSITECPFLQNTYRIMKKKPYAMDSYDKKNSNLLL